jgi:hypothetical protein
VVVGRAGRLQERRTGESLGRHIDPSETQYVGVESHAALDIAYEEHCVVQACDAHEFFLVSVCSGEPERRRFYFFTRNAHFPMSTVWDGAAL